MDYHLERKVVLDNDPKYKNLYTWCLSEVADPPARAATGQIPWPWSLYFTLSEIELQLGVRFDPFRSEDEAEAKVETTEVIRAKLRPGSREGHDEVRYSMFGTGRRIEDFALRIQRVSAGVEEHCRAWGVVSYTTEHDFRDETLDDCLGFDLCVSAERFARIADLLTLKALGGGVLRVRSVSGFYSDWSPSITTRDVKVLSGDEKDHRVEIAEDCDITPPRLNEVREFDLTLWTETVQRSPKPAAEAAEDEEPDYDDHTSRTGSSSPPLPAGAPSLLPVLKSLRLALWVVVALLVILVLK